MNTNILKKCLDELNKDNPRKDYVIGMLETLVDTQNQIPQFTPNSNRIDMSGIIPDMSQFPVIDGVAQEQDQLAKIYGGGPIGNI